MHMSNQNPAVEWVSESEPEIPTALEEITLPDEAKAGSPKLRVLIADDAIAVKQSLARLLGEIENVEVAGLAQDVGGTIQAIRSLKPEVVILDIRMPGGSGLDVLEKFQQVDWAPKVIVFTNYAFAPYRKKCLETGASFFLDKSTEFDQLPEALEQLRLTTIVQGR